MHTERAEGFPRLKEGGRKLSTPQLLEKEPLKLRSLSEQKVGFQKNFRPDINLGQGRPLQEKKGVKRGGGGKEQRKTNGGKISRLHEGPRPAEPLEEFITSLIEWKKRPGAVLKKTRLRRKRGEKAHWRLSRDRSSSGQRLGRRKRTNSLVKWLDGVIGCGKANLGGIHQTREFYFISRECEENATPVKIR